MKKLIGLETLKTQEDFDSLKGRTVVCTVGLFKGIEGKIENVNWTTEATPTKSNPNKRKRKGVRSIAIQVVEEHPNGKITKYRLHHLSNDINCVVESICGKKGFWKLVS